MLGERKHGDRWGRNISGRTSLIRIWCVEVKLHWKNIIFWRSPWHGLKGIRFQSIVQLRMEQHNYLILPAFLPQSPLSVFNAFISFLYLLRLGNMRAKEVENGQGFLLEKLYPFSFKMYFSEPSRLGWFTRKFLPPLSWPLHINHGLHFTYVKSPYHDEELSYSDQRFIVKSRIYNKVPRSISGFSMTLYTHTTYRLWATVQSPWLVNTRIGKY